MNWQQLKSAIETVMAGNATKIEGEGWAVYRVGTVIRVDIKA